VSVNDSEFAVELSLLQPVKQSLFFTSCLFLLTCAATAQRTVQWELVAAPAVGLRCTAGASVLPLLVVELAQAVGMPGHLGAKAARVLTDPGVPVHVGVEPGVTVRARGQVPFDRLGALAAEHVAIFRYCRVYEFVGGH
jgi:hypothetical protein